MREWGGQPEGCGGRRRNKEGAQNEQRWMGGLYEFQKLQVINSEFWFLCTGDYMTALSPRDPGGYAFREPLLNDLNQPLHLNHRVSGVQADPYPLCPSWHSRSHNGTHHESLLLAVCGQAPWAAGEDWDDGRLGGFGVDAEELGRRLVSAAKCCQQLVSLADEKSEMFAQWLSLAGGEELVSCFDAGERGEAHGRGVDDGSGVVDEVGACCRRAEHDTWPSVSRLVTSWSQGKRHLPPEQPIALPKPKTLAHTRSSNPNSHTSPRPRFPKTPVE